MAKLYPPQLEGTLPAFYKTYDEKDENLVKSCTINIPFGINRAVNISTIDNIALRLRTTSTNTYLIADCPSTNYDKEHHIASFKFDYNPEDENPDLTATLINEGLYYRVQLAFIDKDGTIGYYSTVGIIKCIALPSVSISGFDANDIKTITGNSFMGIYLLNTRFGDSTEKAYSYLFDLFNSLGQLEISSGELLHDVTQDTFSDTSNDIWKIYEELTVGEIYKLRYTVTTLNGLTLSTIDYKMMKAVSIEQEYNIKIHADANYDNGYIDIYLSGETSEKSRTENYYAIDNDFSYDETITYYTLDEDLDYVKFTGGYAEWLVLRNLGKLYLQEISVVNGEIVCTGNYLITRASSLDNYHEWLEITRFTMASAFPSEFHFYDYTVEQGVRYKYAIQQYNVHDLYSNKVYQTDSNGEKNTVMADFEDMFLSDGIRQLKIRFNPKVTSFKNTIPELKIETIGSKYPFIFRNGSVCYKEFPIGGLISFQMDDALLFLNADEQRQAGILDYEYIRIDSGVDNYLHVSIYDNTSYKKTLTLKIPVYHYEDLNKPKNERRILYYRYVTTDYTPNLDKLPLKDTSQINSNISNGLNTGEPLTEDPAIIRSDRNLTSENLMSERYFKLKVLDWLTDGKVKLFRSPAEGNYLVRLLNVQLTPQDPLGRMLHLFTCTGYEVDVLNYTTLVNFGIVVPSVATSYETLWASVDINQIINRDRSKTNEFIKVSPDGVSIEGITIQDFAPGDQIKLVYDSGPDGVFTIGVTGSLELNNDDRSIIEVWIKPNPETSPYDDFSRTFFYQTTNMQLTKFDAVSNVSTYTLVSEQFIGPKDNLLEPYNLRDNVYGERNEDGVVLHPYTYTQAYDNVYKDLIAHLRFTYMLNENTEKIQGYKIDILHVHKKSVIPIYCYYDDTLHYLGPNNWELDGLFGITPFNIPYVNSTNIREFVDSRGTINYVSEVLTLDEYGHFIRNNGINIEDITTVFEEAGVIFNVYDLLEPYYYDANTDEWIPFRELAFNKISSNSVWAPTSKYYTKINLSYKFFDVQAYIDEHTVLEREELAAAEKHLERLLNSDEEIEPSIITQAQTNVTAKTTALAQKQLSEWNVLIEQEELWLYTPRAPGYYNLYTHSWIDANQEYDPSFSINDPDVFPEKDSKGYDIDTPEFVGDNNISLRETEEITLYNLGQIPHIRLGNGVVAEITALIRIVDYEIEETDPATKQAKDEYLHARQLLNDLLDLAMLHASELADAEIEATELIEKIKLIEDLINAYAGNSTATAGVMEVAEKRLIDLKKKLWYTLELQLEDILDILSLQQVYLDIDGNVKVDALTFYDYDDEMADILNFANKELTDNNELYLYNNPATEEETIEINQILLTFKIISEAYIYYDELYQNIMDAQLAIIDQCNNRLAIYAVLRGNIVGGYLEDYDDENPPPENTLVYVEYQLAKIEAAIEAEYNKVVEKKSDLITQLLEEVLLEEGKTLTNLTDLYIVDNADELITLIDSYLSSRHEDLDELKEKFYKKVTHLIFILDKDDEEALKDVLMNNISLPSGYEEQLLDISDLFENKLLNISRKLIGLFEVDPADVPEDDPEYVEPSPSFTNSTGVAKLIIFLRALLALEKEKAEKKLDKEAISALTTWIEYLITNKDSYKYSIPHYYLNSHANIDDDAKIRSLKNELTSLQQLLLDLGVAVVFNSNYECTNFNAIYNELSNLNGTVYDEGNGYSYVIDYSILLGLMNRYQSTYQEFIETIAKITPNLDLAKNNIYTAIYYLENNLSDDPEPLTHTIDLEKIQETVDQYIGKVTKLNLGTDANYTKKADVAAAYAAAKLAYDLIYDGDSDNHSYLFYNESSEAHPYTLLLHNILKQYYQEPESSKDNEGFTTFSSRSPDYNTSLLNKFGKYEALIAAYKGAYDLYAVELAALINTLESLKAILVAITKDPGYIERTYAELCKDKEVENYNQFVSLVNEIKENYIELTTERINPLLTSINLTVYDFLNLTEDSSADEKATALLNLLIDEYNRTSANSVMSYLNEYLKGKGEENISPSTGNKVNAIVQRLKNAEATYQNRLLELNQKKETYLNELNKYNALIEEIETIVKATELNRLHALDLYDEAAGHRSYAAQTVALQDGEALINRIASNATHQGNVALARRYTNWLESTLEGLLAEIGLVFSNVEKSSEYADMLKAFINAYEDEAFEFMHLYDALPEDMHEGYYGNDGIDWLYSRPSEYWLSSYEKILFLNETPFNALLLEALSSLNDTTRTAEYQACKQHLKDLLLLNTARENNNTSIELGVLCKISEEENNENYLNNYSYRLVKLRYENGDAWYPVPYELTDNDYQHPLFVDSEGKGICPCTNTYVLLRKSDELSENNMSAYSDLEFRYVTFMDQDELGIYRKNPYATAYYTYDSVKNKMVDAFGKPIDLVTAEEFNTVAKASVQAQKPIKWLTANSPITVSVLLHTNLFNEFTYNSNFIKINEINLENAITTNANLLTIVPTYYNYYDKVLGLIIHDTKNGEEYGSWYALQEYDLLIWLTISSYFTTCAYYNVLILQAYTADHASYYTNYALLDEYQEELEKWTTIKTECEIVLANYNALNISNDDKKKLQLIVLLDSALDEIEYLENEIARLLRTLEEFLLTNTTFKEFLAYLEMIPEIYSLLSSYFTEFNNNYNIYSNKVLHYLMLVFNNEPYGKYIDRAVLQHEELLHINDNNTNMYNFGLAYAIDAYKTNYNNEEPINFNDITDKINEIDIFLNQNYDFMYPVDKLVPIDPLEEPFNSTYRYYILNELGEYQHTTTINQETYENYTNLYAIKDSQYHTEDGRTYFIKQSDGSFVKYRKINDTTWYEDLLILDLWYTYYPSLIDFASIENYKCINDENEVYDPTILYYTLNNGSYEPISVTPETFTNTGTLYIATGNGGINNFLALLTDGSPYIQKIKDNYNGTYALYESLLALTLGDTTTLNNLRNLLTTYQVRLKELEDILKYKTADSIDTKLLISDIYDKLTHYLVTLTNAYIELVERSYGVV